MPGQRTAEVDIERIRAKIRSGQFTIYTHAMVEAMKDGLLVERRRKYETYKTLFRM